MSKLTYDEIYAHHQVLRTNPQKYVDIVTDRIALNPDDASAYFSRHHGWICLGQPENALTDLSRSIELNPRSIAYQARGNILAQIGRHAEALNDYAKAEAMAPVEWNGMWGPLYLADSHAQLGHESEAIAACDSLPEDHWSPGLFGAPEGNKQEVIAEIRRRLAAARK